MVMLVNFSPMCFLIHPVNGSTTASNVRQTELKMRTWRHKRQLSYSFQ